MEGTIPTIFPNTPKYWSNNALTSRRLADAEDERFEQTILESLKEYQEYKEKDTINSLSDIVKYITETRDLRNLVHLLAEDKIFLLHAQAWVKDLFEDEDIDMPDFKNDEESRKLILKIILLNKVREKDAKEAIKIESFLSDCYTQKEEEISSQFAFFPITDLQPNVVENVNKIASLAAQLNLKEPTVTNFLLGSSSLARNKVIYEEQELVNSYKLSKISQQITELKHKTRMIEKHIDRLQLTVEKQLKTKPVITEQCNFYKTKSEEYMRRIHKAQDMLKNLGFDQSLSHSEMVKKADSLLKLEEEVNGLNEKLESYLNLPPNETLTRFKIEEAQRDLLRLQNEFDDLLKL